MRKGWLRTMVPSERNAADVAAGSIGIDTIDFKRLPDAHLDWPTVIQDALVAAGVAPAAMSGFAEATELIVARESAWRPNAVAVFTNEGRVMADGAPHSAQRGATQLTPWTFADHHVPGTSVGIYDPVANIAAAWHMVSADFGVDLRTGQGLAEFVAKVQARPGRWFGESP